MLNIKFSQSLIRYLPLYMGITVSELIEDMDFPYSKIYFYKLTEGSHPITDNVSRKLNEYWKAKRLNQEDLNNLYRLVEIIEIGSNKHKRNTLTK